MDTLIMFLIVIGSIVMIANVIIYILFMRKMRDVISSGVKPDNAMLLSGLILIIFFLGGYVFIIIKSKPNLMIALVLFFGSFFVSLAIILMNKLIQTSKNRSLEIAQVLISIIDSYGPNIQGHSLHVKNLMTTFYEYLPRNLREDYSIISIEYAALFHDIGKLDIPSEILNKEEPLTSDEWKLMRNHPKQSVRMLREIRSFDYIADWILYHHERIDGEGYFYKKGDSIPFLSRMLAIADAYSSMTMGRTYRKKMSHEEALEIIKQEEGKQFDEKLAEIFISIPKEKLIACMPTINKY